MISSDLGHDEVAKGLKTRLPWGVEVSERTVDLLQHCLLGSEASYGPTRAARAFSSSGKLFKPRPNTSKDIDQSLAFEGAWVCLEELRHALRHL